MRYVNVIIDNSSIHTDRLYTYGFDGKNLEVGNKVYVPFGKGDKRKAAYVISIFSQLEKPISNLKFIEEVDDQISLNEEMIKTCLWMKKRYACRYIDAIRLFLPAGKPSAKGKKRRPYGNQGGDLKAPGTLTEEQATVITRMEEKIKGNEHEIFLLHGVTGSGKTEVYIQIIDKVLKKGQRGIVLVPEISLTKQMIERFIGRFGEEQVAILHSRLTLGQRYDEWQRIRNKEVNIVIGARSAIFAPMEDIGIVVLDEEHESTYKSDKTPKYETVELAIKRSKAYQGIVVLGSATPSVVSYYRGQEGIYKLLTMSKRYNEVPLPQVELVNMGRELREGNQGLISGKLLDEMTYTLGKGKQVILFLNRRGYFPYITCLDCGHVVTCPDCEISLSYHKKEGECLCHYCGKTLKPPRSCEKCGSMRMGYSGKGTEQVEEVVSQLFPDLRVERLDLDSTKKKGSLEKILEDFGKGRIHILTGTQIVAKGLDFHNVGLVGIISADTAINIPDYRSSEKAFQLITQAAGRAGRGKEEGKVIIQTYSPDHYAIIAGGNQNYLEYYYQEISLREMGDYPPFSDMIQIVFSSKWDTVALEQAKSWERKMKTALGDQGIIFPNQQARAKGKSEDYRRYILIKCLPGQRKVYMKIIEEMQKEEKTKRGKYRIGIDINPYSIGRN